MPATETLAAPLPPAPAPEARRYCSFVEVAHPLVDALFGSVTTPACDAEGTLAECLDAARRHTVYRSNPPGRHRFDELAARRRSVAPLPANCIDLCCLIAAGMRRRGVGPHEVWVTLGGLRRFAQQHAALLVRRPGDDFWWIDPIDLRPEVASGARILDRWNVYALFNDRELRVTPAEKRALLEPAGR